MSAFGSLIRSKRDALGLTLDDVATASGTTKSHLHSLENGNTPNPGILTCTRLSVVLGISVQSMAAAALSDAMGESS